MRSSEVTPKGYLKILRFPLLFALLSLAAAVLFARGIQYQSLPRVTGVFVKLRMQETIDKLPDLYARDSRFAFFWGPSEIEDGLETEVLDQVFKKNRMDVKAVNVGMRNVHPMAYRAFAERVAHDLEVRGQKIEISFIKFPTGKLTKIYRRNYPYATVLDEVGQVLPFSDLEFAKSRPLVYLGAAVNHYVLRDASLAIVHDFFKTKLDQWMPQPETRKTAAYFSIWQDPKFLERHLWDLEARGAYRFNRSASEEAFKEAVRAKQDRNLQTNSYFYFERCCGLNSLEFDMDLIEDFAAAVNSISRVSKKVYIYQIPETEDYNIWRRSFFLRKIQGALSVIDEKVNAEILDTTRIKVPADGYLDFLHLNHEGQRQFYGELMKKINAEPERAAGTSRK